MHNVWVRLNAVIFFGLSVLLAMATMTAISTYWHDSDIEVRMCVATCVIIRVHRHVLAYVMRSAQPRILTLTTLSFLIYYLIIQIKTLRMSHLKTLRNHGGQDRAVLELDLDADLRPAFHWNLKQLFVYVVAEYESKRNKLNQVVIWDAIIQSADDAHIRFKEQSVKYALIDQGAELRNKTITLKLQWDHMPLTGRMYIHERIGSQFTLPAKYVLK